MKPIEVITVKHIMCIIQLFHEVLYEEFPTAIQGHPYMIMHADGSGDIVETRTKVYYEFNGKGDYPNGVLYTFHSIDELVNKADELTKKHGKEWRSYVEEKE